MKATDPGERSSEDLLSAIRSDPEALATLYRRHVGTTVAFAVRRLDPNDSTAIGEALAERGYSVSWTLESNNQGQSVDAPPDGTVVTWVLLSGPHAADIRLAPAGPDAVEYQRAEGTFLPGETPPWQPPCTG